MIDNFSVINTGGGGRDIMGFCHKRHAVMNPFFLFFFKGQGNTS